MNHISSPQDFDRCVKQKKAVVMFSASWCGPCKVAKPKIQELRKKHMDTRFCYVDIDAFSNHPQVSRISSVPTFWVIRDGRKVFSSSGLSTNTIKAIESKL